MLTLRTVAYLNGFPINWTIDTVLNNSDYYAYSTDDRLFEGISNKMEILSVSSSESHRTDNFVLFPSQTGCFSLQFLRNYLFPPKISRVQIRVLSVSHLFWLSTDIISKKPFYEPSKSLAVPDIFLVGANQVAPWQNIVLHI